MNRRIKSLSDIEIVLRPYIKLVKKLTGKDTTLERIKPLMSFLGHPENNIRTIHIAGTSGKTSTAYYISSLLSQSGNKVGLTISPHVDKINERVQINNRPLNESIFCEQLEKFLKLVQQSGIKPSYFELMCSFSIWLFDKYKVDYAVIETGVGGLYDATNVINNEDKICVITDIGFDHMSLLGNTIEEITSQKIGIVHDHNDLLMYQQSPQIMSVINNWVKVHNGHLHLIKENQERENFKNIKSFKNLPDFQKRNWLLAYSVYRFIAQRDSLKSLDIQQIEESQQIIIPARMDKRISNNKIIIMDGAHNFQKMSSFISSYINQYPNTKPAILLAFKNDKDYLQTLPLIKNLASEIIVTTFKTSQDLPVLSTDPEEIANQLLKIGTKNVSVEKDNMKAYIKLLKSSSKHLIITGSFYLISQVRSKISK
jgi:dihydrofolate synthase/folylpolyglutamate synthase